MQPKIDGVKDCFSRFATSLDLNEVIPLFSLVTFGDSAGSVILRLDSVPAQTFVDTLATVTTLGGIESGLDATLRAMDKAHSMNLNITYRTSGNARKVFILVTNEDSDVSRTPTNRFSHGEETQSADFCLDTSTASKWAPYQEEINAVAQGILDQDIFFYSFVAGQKSLADQDVSHAYQCNTYAQYCNPGAQTQSLNNLKFDPYSTRQKLLDAGQAESVQGLLLTNFRYSRCYDVADTLVPEFVNSFFTLVVKDVSRCNTVCPLNSQLTLTWDPETGNTVANCECLPGHVFIDGLCPAISCPRLEYQNAVFPQTLAALPAHGACNEGYTGVPILLCHSNGSWSSVVESPCTENEGHPTAPECRDPQFCGEITEPQACNACYKQGGLVLDLLQTACFCPKRSAIFDPESESCATPLPLCPSAFFCNDNCLTCLGPNADQCLTCADADHELFRNGSSASGSCRPPCQPTQYVTFDGQCADVDCSRLSNCSAHGSCIWDGTKSICLCDPGFEGDNCSTGWTCPLHNHCSGQGDCIMNMVIDELECQCDFSWTGQNCSDRTISVFPSKSNELGGAIMTVSGNFSPSDNVTCEFGFISLVPATVIAPNATCQIPPHHTATSISFSVIVNGVYHHPEDTKFYYYSEGLPSTQDEWDELIVEPKKDFVVEYDQTTLSGPLVTVSLFCWHWIYYMSNDPELRTYGVVGSGPNTGSVTVNLNRTFDWDEALCILSFAADQGTWRRYALPLKGVGGAGQRCNHFASDAPVAHFDGDCPPKGQFGEMEPCKPEVLFPNLFPGFGPLSCFTWTSSKQVCLYGSGGTAVGQLWEPFVISEGTWPVVQYLVSIQLPKYFCCSVSNCQGYLSERSPPNNPGARRSTPLPSQVIHRMALAQVFGNLHFVTLDGSKYTFNGLGEFILLQDPSSSLVVQIRTSPLPNRKATRLSAVSISYLESKLAVHLDPFGRFLFLFNDKYVTHPLAIGEMRYVTGGQVVIRRLQDRVLRVTLANSIVFTLESNQRLAISMKILVPVTLAGSGLRGLIGSFDDNRANDLTTQNGTVLPHDATAQDVQYTFGLSWMLSTQAESLFIYASGMAFEDKRQPTFQPEYPGTQPSDPELTLEAQLACKGVSGYFREACVFDVVQSRTYAASTAALRMGQMYAGYSSLLSDPPVITGLPDHKVVHLGELVSLTFQVAHSPDTTISAYVASSPEPFLGTFDPVGLRYELLVGLTPFLDQRERQVRFIVVDGFQGTAEAVVTLSVAYSTCAESEDSVKVEAEAELEYHCLASAAFCTQACLDVLTRIEDLPCYKAIAPGISPVLEEAEQICREGVPTDAAPPPDSLSGGQIAGLILGLLLVVGLMVAGGIFLRRWIKAKFARAYVPMGSKVDLGYDRFDVE